MLTYIHTLFPSGKYAKEEKIDLREKYMPFVDFIRKKRLDHSKGLQAMDAAEYLGISFGYMSNVENRRKRPFEKKLHEKLA